MVFLLLCASSNTVLQCMAKMGPQMSLGESNMGCPCPGRLGNTDPGHTAPRIPLLGLSPDHCHCTGTAMAGAGVLRRQAHRALDPASNRQRLPSAKNR